MNIYNELFYVSVRLTAGLTWAFSLIMIVVFLILLSFYDTADKEAGIKSIKNSLTIAFSIVIIIFTVAFEPITTVHPINPDTLKLQHEFRLVLSMTLGIIWGYGGVYLLIKLLVFIGNKIAKWGVKVIETAMGIQYEEKKRYVRFVVKHKRYPNRSGWVYAESPKRLYIQSDKSPRKYSITKNKIGYGNVVSLEYSNAEPI